MNKLVGVRNFCRCRDVFGLPGNGFVIGDDHPAAAGGDNLVAVKADGTEQTETSGVLALEVAAQRFGGVFDQRDAELGADLCDLVDAARVAEGVHGHAGGKAAAGALVVGNSILHLGIGGQKVAQRVRAHAQRALVHVHENGVSTDVGDRIAGGDEGQRLGDDLVTPFDASDDHRNVECCGAVDRCHAVFGTAVCCNALFELSDAGTDRRDEI